MGKLSDVINFIVLKQKFSKDNKEQSLIGDDEPKLKYAKFYNLMPMHRNINLFIENIDKNDINTIHGELEIMYLSQELTKIVWEHSYRLE